MMKRLISILAVLAALTTAQAADWITVIVSVTNAPIGNTNTFTLNGSTRTFTNEVTSAPGLLIQETNSIPWTATNLLDHWTDYPLKAGHFLSQQASNEFRIRGLVGETMTASQAGNWAAITYSTQSVSTPRFIVAVPFSGETATNQTNIASMLITGLQNSTNAFRTNDVAVSNLLVKGAVPAQTVSGAVTFGGLSGNVGSLTNGYWTNGVFDTPTFTNGVAYGLTINSGSITGATAIALSGSGVDNIMNIMGASTIAAVGPAFYLERQNGPTTAVDAGDILGIIGFAGYGDTARRFGARIRANPTETFTDSSAPADLEFATAPSGSTTLATRLTVGAEGNVTVANVLLAGSQTNSTLRGTNIVNGRLDLTAAANTGLANGNNSGVVLGTNVYLRLSGATTIAAIAGFAAEQNGSYHIIQISGSITNTILNDSGVDATPANRIITGTGADLSLTNNPSFINVIYDTAASRWRLINWTQ